MGGPPQNRRDAAYVSQPLQNRRDAAYVSKGPSVGKVSGLGMVDSTWETGKFQPELHCQGRQFPLQSIISQILKRTRIFPNYFPTQLSTGAETEVLGFLGI